MSSDDDHTGGWTGDAERLLKNWSRQISINEDQYRKRGAYYRNWYWAFGVFLAIAQTGILTTLVNVIVSITSNAKHTECAADKVNVGALIFVAVMGSIILVAQGIDKFFNFGSGSEQFFDAAKDHNALSRLIDATMMLPRSDRDDAREVLLSIRQQFDQIQYNSPNLPPSEIIHRLDMCIYDDPHLARGNRSSTVYLPSPETINILNSPPPLPPTVETVQLPPDTDTDTEATTSTEDCVSATRMCHFNSQLQEQKTDTEKAEQNKKGLLKYLEYQWRRLERHAEESDPSDNV